MSNFTQTPKAGFAKISDTGKSLTLIVDNRIYYANLDSIKAVLNGTSKGADILGPVTPKV